MVELVALFGVLTLMAAAGLLTGAVVVMLLGVTLLMWIVILPLRALGWLVLFPLLVVKWLFGVLFGLLLLPVLCVVAVIGAAVLIMLPLLPLLVLGLLLWAAVALVRRPATASGRVAS